MGTTFLLYKFFKAQQNGGLTSASLACDSAIDDRFWERASHELESGRHEATWARAMASAEGDDAKTKALYLKMRAKALQDNESASRMDITITSAGSVSRKSAGVASNLNIYVFAVAALAIGGAVVYFSFDAHRIDTTGVVAGAAQTKPPLFRRLSDGTNIRWSRDSECFIKMTLDYTNPSNTVFLSRTSSSQGTRYKELTQEDRLVAVLFFDEGVSDDEIAWHITREKFLTIKAMCDAKF